MDALDTFVGRLSFARKLREAELGTSIGDKDIAAKAGVSPSAVSQWISGKVDVTNLKASPVFGAARFLRVRPEWLWDKSGPMRDAQDELPPGVQKFYADLKKALSLGMAETVIPTMHCTLRAMLTMHERSHPLDLNAPTPPSDTYSNRKLPHI